MRIQQAILEFLGNEFQLESQSINTDTTFAELGVFGASLNDLLQRLQDALSIVLPEEKLANMTTVGDLLEIVQEDDQVV